MLTPNEPPSEIGASHRRSITSSFCKIMNMHILIATAIGAGVGALSTFVVMRSSDTISQPAVVVRDSPRSADGVDRDTSTDPFEGIEKSKDAEEASDYPIEQMDMTNPVQRDICISFWYMGMTSVVETLETQTGHKFKPVAKLSAGPVEILEEQAAFMREFLAETRRLGDTQ
jgi:hypothetical protein